MSAVSLLVFEDTTIFTHQW